MSDTIDSGNWLAERFAVSSSTAIDSIAAYLLSASPTDDAGKTFTIALYADQGGLPALNLGQLYQATATYTQDGWTSVSSLGWQLNAGQYWVSLQGGDAADSALYLQAPVGATPAADAVAYYSGGARFSLTSSSETFGVQISAVPEPGSLSLAVAGMGLLWWVQRRRS
mgnify:CR=1 FL=1